MKRFKSGTPARELIDDLGDALAELGVDDEDYAVLEKAAERRITYGVMYQNGVHDAHGEFADLDELEDACRQYLASGDTKIRKQHGSQVIGELVGLMPWPFETEVELKPISGVRKAKKVKLPEGTVYAAVKWTPEGWDLVKREKIRGFSMGGKAKRVKEA